MTTIQLRDYERDRRQRRLARKSHQKRPADRLTKNKKERDRYRKKALLPQTQATQTPPAVPTKASLHTLPAGYAPSIGIIPMRPISEVRASWQNSPSSTIIVAGPEESSTHSLSSPLPSHFPLDKPSFFCCIYKKQPGRGYKTNYKEHQILPVLDDYSWTKLEPPIEERRGTVYFD